MEATKIQYLNPDVFEVSEKLTGRVKVGDTAELEQSIMSVGQLQPIVFRTVKDDDGTHQVVVFGHRRLQAIRNLHETDASYQVAAVDVKDLDDLEAFKYNLAENRSRKQTTPIDDLENFKVLKEKFEMKDEDIANTYGMTRAWVSMVWQLDKLNAKEKELLANGKMTFTDAVAHARSVKDLNPEDRKEIVKGLVEKAKDGKISGEDFKAQVREVTTAAEKSGSVVSAAPVTRSLKNLKETLEVITESQKGTVDPALQDIGGQFRKYLAGKVDSIKMIKNCETIIEKVRSGDKKYAIEREIPEFAEK